MTLGNIVTRHFQNIVLTKSPIKSFFPRFYIDDFIKFGLLHTANFLVTLLN